MGYSLDTNNSGSKIVIGANFNNDAYPIAGKAVFYDSGALTVSSTGKVLEDSVGVTFTEGVNAYRSPPIDRNNNGVYDFLEVTRPEVVLQPESISVLAGETRTFTTSISFFTTFDLQWQSSTNSGTTWTNLPENSSFTNVNSPTLNVLNIQTSQDKHQFRVAVIPFCGNTVYSNAALLSVNATNTCLRL